MGSDNARNFLASGSNKITTGLGALGFAFGPGTIAAVCLTPSAFAISYVLSTGTVTTGNDYGLGINASGAVRLLCGSVQRDGVSALSTSSWYLIAVTKATGTVAPRMHFYSFASAAWTHENSAGTAANSGVPVTEAKIGCISSSANFWNSDIYAAAVWNVVLTDAQIQLLAADVSLALWSATAVPKGMWQLNQASTGTSVTDLTGGGANQSAITGTSISAFPFFLLGPKRPPLRAIVTTPSLSAMYSR